VVFSLHDAGHLIIVISPVCQSISGLCSMSHVCPRIIIVQPMLVMWNVSHLECSFYWTIRSMTLVICLALYGGTIDIVDQGFSRQSMSLYVLQPYEFDVNEHSSGS